MTSFGKCIIVAALIVCGGFVVRHVAWGQRATPDPHGEAKERAHIVLSKELANRDVHHDQPSPLPAAAGMP
jgi:hypothetical protein